MKSQAASRKKLPIMGSCTNTRNFDTGQIDATSRQLLHSSRPQIDMKTPRRITMRYTIYIETKPAMLFLSIDKPANSKEPE